MAVLYFIIDSNSIFISRKFILWTMQQNILEKIFDEIKILIS